MFQALTTAALIPLCTGAAQASPADTGASDTGAPDGGAALVGAPDIGPWDLVRVDVPDYPGAEATSRLGSVLLAPPDDPDLPWRPEPVPQTDGVVAWEAIEAMAVQPWHDQGLAGQGVKVAVFDSQFYNAQLRGQELVRPGTNWGDDDDGLTTRDCYAHRSCEAPIDTINPRYSWEMGAHGVACAEVIRDVAPQVELYLVRVNGLTSLENAVDWAIREGVDLISMSLSFFNEAYYDGTGAINTPMDDLAAADILMVTSAGNYARQHWMDTFRDADQDGLYELPSGSEYLPIWLPEGEQRVSLIWDDFSSCGSSDLDAYVYNQQGELVGRSTEVQDREADRCSPVERVRAQVADSGWHYLQIHLAAGDPLVHLDVMATSGEIWQAQPLGSVADPATHPAVLAVGAVRADGYQANQQESFSSQGPTHAGLPKPEISGPDGVSTLTYGPTGFYGTSASTPSVVGALALLLSEEPGLSPHDAAQRLIDSAANSEQPTWTQADPALGAGRARLPPPHSDAAGCRGGLGHLWLLPWLPFLRRRRQRDT